MKHIDEYRDSSKIKSLCDKISSVTTKQWKIMEVCGGQTHSILKYSLEELLPSRITLLHGPGCPVCVTPVEMIDRAIYLSGLPDVILVSYGDMLRVPGTFTDLLSCKANGADIRMLYSPIQAIKIAKENPDKRVVFFSVGFETTAPANALSIAMAKKDNIDNYFMLCSHVTIPPALELLQSNSVSAIQGFLLPGHVCTVMGYVEYIPIAKKYKVPAVVTGFEPADILIGVYALIRQLESGTHFVENQYKRTVQKEGNKQAKAVLDEIFVISDRIWRGIGNIPYSGLKIKEKYSSFDAEVVFGLADINIPEKISSKYNQKIHIDKSVCRAGEILQGISKPSQCPAFGCACTPEYPLGAPMVSSEGACSAYYTYWKK